MKTQTVSGDAGMNEIGSELTLKGFTENDRKKSIEILAYLNRQIATSSADPLKSAEKFIKEQGLNEKDAEPILKKARENAQKNKTTLFIKKVKNKKGIEVERNIGRIASITFTNAINLIEKANIE